MQGDLVRLARIRDEAEKELIQAIKEADRLLDGIRDYWNCQASGAE